MAGTFNSRLESTCRSLRLGATVRTGARGLRLRYSALAIAATAVMAVSGLALGSVALAATDPTDSAQTVPIPDNRVPPSFADLVQKVLPAVVSVEVKGYSRPTGDESQIPLPPDLPEDSGPDDLIERFRQDRSNEQADPQPTLTLGSGFIIAPDGYIVTSEQVMENALETTVTLESGEKLPATLVGTDPLTDVALIKVDTKGRAFPSVQFASEEARVGDWVLVIGNQFGLGGTVTAGVISARSRDIGLGPYDVLQIDASVNPGNSGGPTFNLEGKVIGMNAAIFTPILGNVGIAFAVPAALVKEAATQLREHGRVERAWLGVVTGDVSPEIADAVGFPKPEGAIVVEVSEDGPAAKADIKPGDVIVELNGEKITSSRDLARKTAALQPNTAARLTIIGQDERRQVEIKLGTYPSTQGAPLSQ